MDAAMNFRDIAMDVGLAIRRPEQLVRRWNNAKGNPVHIFIAVLLANAVFGVAAYGVTMQMHNGAVGMLRAAVLTPLAAGCSWLIALPALYIFNSSYGSRLSLQATILAASVTMCFGAWAMLASVPINWFFTLSLPYATTRLLTNLVVFMGVGVCMTDVFVRVLAALEPDRSPTYGYLWVGLVAVLGMELYSLLGIFTF